MIRLPTHLPLVWGEARRSSRQAILFILSMALALSGITAFAGLSSSVNRALAAQARQLHAADIIVSSNQPLSSAIATELNAMVEQGIAVRAGYVKFNSVVRSVKKDASLITEVKVVESGYPFYGKVVLRSERPFNEVLSPGGVIVDQNLLDRMGLAVGDMISLGYRDLQIADVVVSEPDRPVDLFSLGPRVFVSLEDLPSLGLVDKGSRIAYTTLLKVPQQDQVAAIASSLSSVAEDERVETSATASSPVKRFLERFLQFVRLSGLFTLIIAAFGIQASLSAVVHSKAYSIAIMKIVGATNRYATVQFMLLIAVLSLMGIVLGFLLGYGLQAATTNMMQAILPHHVSMTIDWTGIAEGVLVGILVAALFALIPMRRISQTKPILVFRHESASDRTSLFERMVFAVGLLLFTVLVVRHIGDLQIGLIISGGVVCLLLLSYLLASIILGLISGISLRNVTARQAFRGLFRKGFSVPQIVMPLTASLAALLQIYLLQANLERTFVSSFPRDVPNLFLIDIQKSQVDQFKDLMGAEAEVYPVVRGRIRSIAGQPVDQAGQSPRFGDRLTRVFNMTYRDELLNTESLTGSESLFRSDWEDVQVSVLDDVLEMRGMSVGDWIEFDIQGVPLRARISSFRTRLGESTTPYFYFVFPYEVLSDAPQTFFSALTIPPDQVSRVQTRIVDALPNVTAIDVSEAAKIGAEILDQLVQVLRVLTALGIAAGVLLLMSAIAASRQERLIETVYFKVLGATRLFVFKVFALENLFIGILSAVAGLVIAHAGAYFICQHFLDIGYQPYIFATLCIAMGAIGLIVLTGLLASLSIMKQRPIAFLREQSDE